MKKAKKKKRLNVRKLFVFILFFYIVGFGIYYLFSEPIRNIIIEGNTYVKDVQIIEIAGIKNYPSIFSLNTKKIANKIKSIDLVEDVKIKRNLKFQLTIEVIEKKIICLYDDNKVLLSDGSLIEDNNYLGVPSLINYTPKDILNKFLNSMGDISYDIINSISEIEYSPSKSNDGEVIDETRFILYMNDGNIIYINLNKMSLLKSYLKIYASLGDNKGILHLDSGEYLEVK